MSTLSPYVNIQNFGKGAREGLTPTGTVLPFAGSASPDGYLMCDGSVLNREAYADLFAVISTAFNSGTEAANEFRLPDMRGRVVVGTGYDASAANNVSRTLGGKGGDTRMPQHNHSVSDPGHSHTTTVGYYLAGGSGGNNFRITDGSGSYVGPVAAGTDSKTTGISVGNQGSGVGDNMPPFAVLNYIIKY